MRPVAEQLGLPAEQLEARLYKLLVYEKGGFFLPHRDSEKHDRMVASLIVVLPNPFEGGTLIVRHGAAKETLTFAEAAAGKAPCYAAFYADCEHEVQRVTRGVRLCLAYNLVLKPNSCQAVGRRESGRSYRRCWRESIGSWVGEPAGEAAGFRAGTSLHGARLVAGFAERSGSPARGPGRSGGGENGLPRASGSSFTPFVAVRRRRQLRLRWFSLLPPASERTLEIGETYEDDLNGTQWADVRGRKQPWGTIAFDPSAIVSSTPIDDWKPTSEEYEGYTGNAGNTLDRWYHRSALVVWHRDHHFDIVASSGAADSIPLFCSMTAKLAKTPKKRLEEARNDCIRFARAIIAHWPRRMGGYWHSVPGETSPYADFPEQLLKLHDRDMIALFLSKAGGTGSDAAAGFICCSRVPRVRMERLRSGVEAASRLAARRIWPAGTPVPRCRVAFRLLLRRRGGL